MLIKQILTELIQIKRELQGIHRTLEFSKFVPEDSNEKHYGNIGEKHIEAKNC